MARGSKRTSAESQRETSRAGNARTRKADPKKVEKFEQERVVDPRGARALALGNNTATGQEYAKAVFGEEIPKGKDRGNPDAPTGIKPDGPPTGQQKEPAVFVSNGSIDAGMIGTPTGPVPVAAVADTPEAAEKRLAEHRKNAGLGGPIYGIDEEIPEHVVNGMSGAEARAIAETRGYDVGLGGTFTTRRNFLAAQKDDKNLKRSR